ncbi:unnamed protein product [Paramecium octaurelia]|uniref:Uncharacterized protein n=1 Tax=Paramecium octaurelia TaxID=43137 RepID=A0A8S1W5Q7_PAROT|nr:unnamed protein product [Paramecium octaurelia]
MTIQNLITNCQEDPKRRMHLLMEYQNCFIHDQSQSKRSVFLL